MDARAAGNDGRGSSEVHNWISSTSVCNRSQAHLHTRTWAEAVRPEGEPQAPPADGDGQGDRRESLQSTGRYSLASRGSVKSFLKTTPVKDESWRRKVWIWMEEPDTHPVALVVHYFYSILIMLSVLSTVIKTLDGLSEEWTHALAILEMFFNILFTLEVLARAVCAPQKCLLFRNMYFWMDVGAILPFYITLVFHVEQVMSNKYLELVSLLVPILRLLKITRQSSGWRILVHSIRECAEPLTVPTFLLLLMTVFSSCIIYWLEKHFACEGEDCFDEERKAFLSIPHAMWFTICTISTVGYGDVSPNTDAAKFASAALILAGVCYMAMPLAIIGGTFVSVWHERERLLMRDKTKRRFAEGGITQDDLRNLFETADQDGGGSLKRSEFMDLVEAFQLGMTQEQIVKLFQTVDSNNSGEISFDEFALFLFPELAPKDGELDRSMAPSWYQEIHAVRCGSGGRSPPRKSPFASPLASPRRSQGDSPRKAGSAVAQRAPSRPLSAAHGSALGERVERLEAAVEQLREEQRRHFEAEHQVLESLAARLRESAPSPTRTSVQSPSRTEVSVPPLSSLPGIVADNDPIVLG